MRRTASPLSAAVRRRNYAFGAVCLWCFLASFCSVPAARAQYRFDAWTADDGLPQNIIRDIHQTRDGYLWLATLDGLVRFDGLRFTVFNKSNSPGINSNRFMSLYEDHEGALWAGTEDGRITRYVRGHFQTWTTQDAIASNHISGISGDEHGSLWVLSGNKVMRWDEGRFQLIAPGPLTDGGGVLGPGGRGNFWGVNETELQLYLGGRMTSLSRKDGLPSLHITSVFADRRGALWAATEDAGLTKIEGNRVVKVYRAGDGLPGDSAWPVVAAGPTLKVFSKDRRGALWLTEMDSGASRLLAERPPAALSSLTYYRLFEDREGNLWIGTEGGGLYRARPQAVTAYSKEQGLADRNIYPTIEDHGGGIWVGGATHLTRIKDGEFTIYTARNSSLGRVNGGLYVDREGRLWVGTDLGVQVFDRGRFRVVEELRELTRGPHEVMAMHQDRQGALWLGAQGGRLIRYENGATSVYSRDDGMAGDDIKVIIEDAAGALWVGAYGGLTRYKDGGFTGWTERDGLPGDSVRALHADADGALWVGTYDSGLGRFKDGKFTRYTTRDGLYNDGVFQILEDARGNLWMSCNRGIYRVSRRELNEFAEGRRSAITSVAYGKSNGMLNAECNGGRSPAGVRARDGKLWFPTQDGVAVVDPETISINQLPPPVEIESILVDREPVALDRPVRIAPGRDDFEIGYTALSFVDAGHVRFKYKLEGLDRDWVDAGTRRAAYYSHAPPGSYTFRVIAANSDGVWNTEGQSLKVVVLPFFYQTGWFMALVVLSSIAAVFLLYRYRIALLRREHVRQQAFSRQLIESQERERKRIAAELHDSLGQQLLVVKNRALLGLLQPDDAARAVAELREISTTVSQSLDEVRQIAAGLHPYQLDRLGLTKAIEAMIRKVAAAAGINITAEIDNVNDLFDAPAEINLYRIVQESLNNIIKHSAADAAGVVIKRADGSVTVAVRDNGRGFAAGDQKNGFGLAGIAERVSMLGGSHAVDSIPGQGTTLTLTIGLKNGQPSTK